MTTVRILLVLLLALALGSGVAREGYFPGSAGLSWTYDNGETQTLSGPRELEGRDVMVLVHYLNGRPVSEDYMEFAPDGVWSHGSSTAGRTFVYDPPLLVYQGDRLQVGQSWTSRTRTGGVDITLTVEVLGVRGIETPAGRFNTLHIRQQTVTSTGARNVLELYFVPTVGIVRWVTGDGEAIDLIEKNF